MQGCELGAGAADAERKAAKARAEEGRGGGESGIWSGGQWIASTDQAPPNTRDVRSPETFAPSAVLFVGRPRLVSPSCAALRGVCGLRKSWSWREEKSSRWGKKGCWLLKRSRERGDRKGRVVGLENVGGLQLDPMPAAARVLLEWELQGRHACPSRSCFVWCGLRAPQLSTLGISRRRWVSSMTDSLDMEDAAEFLDFLIDQWSKHARKHRWRQPSRGGETGKEWTWPPLESPSSERKRGIISIAGQLCFACKRRKADTQEWTAFMFPTFGRESSVLKRLAFLQVWKFTAAVGVLTWVCLSIKADIRALWTLHSKSKDTYENEFLAAIFLICNRVINTQSLIRSEIISGAFFAFCDLHLRLLDKHAINTCHVQHLCQYLKDSGMANPVWYSNEWMNENFYVARCHQQNGSSLSWTSTYCDCCCWQDASICFNNVWRKVPGDNFWKPCGTWKKWSP